MVEREARSPKDPGIVLTDAMGTRLLEFRVCLSLLV